jgi:hypothetical protein
MIDYAIIIIMMPLPLLMHAAILPAMPLILMPLFLPLLLR